MLIQHLLLPYKEWKQLIGDNDSTFRKGLSEEDRLWLEWWENGNLQPSEVSEHNLGYVRWAHYFGWIEGRENLQESIDRRLLTTIQQFKSMTNKLNRIKDSQ